MAVRAVAPLEFMPYCFRQSVVPSVSIVVCIKSTHVNRTSGAKLYKYAYLSIFQIHRCPSKQRQCQRQ
jgi:hypothetical protein